MTSRNGTSQGPGTPLLKKPGPTKFACDVVTVAEIKLLAIRHSWHWFLLAAFIFPLPIFYLAHSLISDDPAAVSRIVAGTIVFGASFTTGMLVGQSFAAERFMGTLKLVVTMPVSKLAYVLGSLIYSFLMGTLTVAALLLFALMARVEMEIVWTFVPSIVLSVLCLAGLTLFVVSFAPSMQVGNIMAGLLGMVLAIISPVYFTMDQAPLLQRWLGFVSPLRYAADAISASLSGNSDVLIDLVVLSAFAIGAMSLGLWKLPWRER